MDGSPNAGAAKTDDPSSSHGSPVIVPPPETAADDPLLDSPSVSAKKVAEEGINSPESAPGSADPGSHHGNIAVTRPRKHKSCAVHHSKTTSAGKGDRNLLVVPEPIRNEITGNVPVARRRTDLGHARRKVRRISSFLTNSSFSSSANISAATSSSSSYIGSFKADPVLHDFRTYSAANPFDNGLRHCESSLSVMPSISGAAVSVAGETLGSRAVPPSAPAFSLLSYRNTAQNGERDAVPPPLPESMSYMVHGLQGDPQASLHYGSPPKPCEFTSQYPSAADGNLVGHSVSMGNPFELTYEGAFDTPARNENSPATRRMVTESGPARVRQSPCHSPAELPSVFPGRQRPFDGGINRSCDWSLYDNGRKRGFSDNAPKAMEKDGENGTVERRSMFPKIGSSLMPSKFPNSFISRLDEAKYNVSSIFSLSWPKLTNREFFAISVALLVVLAVFNFISGMTATAVSSSTLVAILVFCYFRGGTLDRFMSVVFCLVTFVCFITSLVLLTRIHNNRYRFTGQAAQLANTASAHHRLNNAPPGIPNFQRRLSIPGHRSVFDGAFFEPIPFYRVLASSSLDPSLVGHPKASHLVDRTLYSLQSFFFQNLFRYDRLHLTRKERYSVFAAALIQTAAVGFMTLFLLYPTFRRLVLDVAAPTQESPNHNKKQQKLAPLYAITPWTATSAINSFLVITGCAAVLCNDTAIGVTVLCVTILGAVLQVVAYRFIQQGSSKPGQTLRWRSNYTLIRGGVMCMLAAGAVACLLAAVLVPPRYRFDLQFHPPTGESLTHLTSHEDRLLASMTTALPPKAEGLPKAPLEITVRRATFKALRGGSTVTLLRKTEIIRPVTVSPEPKSAPLPQKMTAQEAPRPRRMQGEVRRTAEGFNMPPLSFRGDVGVITLHIRIFIAIACFLRCVALLAELTPVPTVLSRLLSRLLALCGFQYVKSPIHTPQRVGGRNRLHPQDADVSVDDGGAETKIFITSMDGSRASTTTVILPASGAGHAAYSKRSPVGAGTADRIGGTSTRDTELSSQLAGSQSSDELGFNLKEPTTTESLAEVIAGDESSCSDEIVDGDNTNRSSGLFRRTLNKVSSASFLSRMLPPSRKNQPVESEAGDPLASPADGILMAAYFEPVRESLASAGMMSTIPTLIGTLRRETLNPTPVRQNRARNPASEMIHSGLPSVIFGGEDFGGQQRSAALPTVECHNRSIHSVGAVVKTRAEYVPEILEQKEMEPHKSPFQQYIEKKRHEERFHHRLSINPFSPGDGGRGSPLEDGGGPLTQSPLVGSRLSERGRGSPFGRGNGRDDEMS